jgi:signal transduction histidine kinase/ligand-binding sensor domain-containing protein/DNA-binding response OmpR family regulator
MQKVFLIIAFLIVSLYTSAQDWQNVRFSPLTLKDGLSQLSVTAIFQDSKGLMWFGTRNGLNSYDGKSFKVINLNNDVNFTDNHILALCEDKDRNLWIGTTRGLACIDYFTEKVTCYFSDKNDSNSLPDNYIFSLAIDALNRLIVGTKSGLCVYDSENKIFARNYLNGILKDNPIRSICVSRKGNIFLGTGSTGMLELNQNLELLKIHKSLTEITEGQINTIFEDSNGVIWYGGINKGLSYYNPVTNQTGRFFIKAGIEDNNSIRALEDDKKGNLIIGTYNGLYLFSKKTLRFTPFSEIYIPGGELNHYSVLSVKFDNAGTLWVGTYAGGVSNYHPDYNRFTYYNPAQINKYTGVIGMMVEDKDGIIWIASEGAGLIGWDEKSRKFSYNKIETADAQSYSKNIIKSLYLDNDNILCGTSRSEIYLFNVKTRKFKFLYQLNNDRKVIYDIVKDQNGDIWAGATGDNKGLYRIKKDGSVQSEFRVGKNEKFMFNDVRSLLLLSENKLMIGTRFEGLMIFDFSKNSIEKIELGNNKKSPIAETTYISTLFKDSYNRIWIGVYGDGLYCYTEKSGIIAHFNQDNGLIDENICSVVESGDKNIWIASNSTISVLNAQTNKISGYNNKNGIFLLEITPHAAFKSSDGHLYFSGSNGFISFFPDKISRNNFIPPVIFTSFAVNNSKIDVGDSTGILTQNLNSTREINLKHNQSNISISFAALNYIFPEHNNYAIKLVGAENEWSNIGSRNEVNFANLAPGNYTLMVKASNNDGVWNENPVELNFYIAPPFWKTWWAYTLYFLLFVAVFILVLYYLKIKHDLEARILMKQLEQEKSDEFHKERIQLFTNFSHEMRTPLTMILTPLIDLIDKSELLTPLYKESLQMMQKNANRLLLLVNQLMDFQKTESGKLKLQVSENDLIMFLDEVYLSFNELAKSQKINFIYENPYVTMPAYFDESILEKVCFNLISNAFKFTKPEGTVRLSVEILENADNNILPENVREELSNSIGQLVMIAVSDNGMGISEDNLKDIFTPFYQVHPLENKMQSGSGIGLSLTKSIVKLSHGAIWATSELNAGTTFSVVFPVLKDNFSDNEIVENSSGFTIEEHVELPAMPFDTRNQIVLIIDDDDDIRHFIANTLSTSFKVLTASDGKEGLEIATSELPDIILCDVMMPHISGLELCKKLKSNIKTGHIPIILITSRALSMQIQEGFNAGADEYITKPFRTSLLLLKINTLLQNRERLKNIYSKKFSLESLGIQVVSSDERFMTRINEIIQNNFSNQELDIDFIAGELGLSRTNLYRKVKSLTNMSTIDLIINIRLLTAKRMLIESDLSIAEIAYETGFNSPAYFTTTFKKQYGITPKEFIEQNKIK